VFFFGTIISLFRSLNVAIRPLKTPLGAAGIGVVFMVALLIVFVVVLLLHELTHGIFFWLFTHSRPTFGFKGWYAYAAAPGWYVPRPQFLVIGSAPLILLSLLGVALSAVVPDALVLWIFWGLIGNATGAIGDLYMIIRLVLAPGAVVIEDQGEEVTWYGPTRLR